MGDLTDQQAAQSVKITGSASTGVEDNYLEVTSENRALIQQPASNTGNKTRPAVTSTSSTILTANAARKWAYIANTSGANITIDYATPVVLSQGITILSGSIFFINADSLWTGNIYAIKSGGSVNIDVFEAL